MLIHRRVQRILKSIRTRRFDRTSNSYRHWRRKITLHFIASWMWIPGSSRFFLLSVNASLITRFSRDVRIIVRRGLALLYVEHVSSVPAARGVFNWPISRRRRGDGRTLLPGRETSAKGRCIIYLIVPSIEILRHAR